MDLTRETVETEAEAYATEAPFYAVEAESIETLGDAYRSGEYGWRDAVWVVRWYYRRYLGGYPDRRRRTAEDAFGENDFEVVRDAIAGAIEAESLDDKLGALTGLDGVDVPVASAYLMFIEPEEFIVGGGREWAVLAEAGHLPPNPPEVFDASAYRKYLSACRELSATNGYSLWALYRAIWRLGADGEASG